MEPKKIILVEDEPDTAKVIQKRLAIEGYNVMVTQDAIQAVSFIHSERPDLVILDLMLPGGGGLAVLETLRLSTFTATIPILVLTGMQNETYKQTVLKEGVDAYLEKPYDADELLATIRHILEKRQAR